MTGGKNALALEQNTVMGTVVKVAVMIAFFQRFRRWLAMTLVLFREKLRGFRAIHRPGSPGGCNFSGR